MKIINGEGIFNPEIAIVGEAPGSEEEKQGRPFVGRSGKLLDKILTEVGLDRSKCYITNAVKFRPKNNRTPSEEEIEQYRDLLITELLTIKPKIVILLGQTAFTALSGSKYKLSLYRGIKFSACSFKTDSDDSEIDPINWSLDYIPTYHPSYILRNRKHYGIMVEDFKKALDYCRKH